MAKKQTPDKVAKKHPKVYIQLKSLFIKDLYLKAKNYIGQACKNLKYIYLSEWQT